MKKVVKLTEEDLVNLIKGVINESFRKGELIDAMTLDIKNELELNGFWVEYHDFETFSELHIKGHETVVPWRPNVVKSITIEITMETMESDPMMIVYTHVTTDISGYERFINKVFSIDEGIDFLLRLKENEMVLGKMDQPINESSHDAEGYAKYVKREDYLKVTSILVQNELIDNGLDVYVEEHSWHTLIVEGHKEEDPNRELNIKLIIIEFETFYDDDYELSSDMTDMKLKIYHIGNNVPTFATYNLLDGLDLLIGFKNKGLLPSTNNETINESFGNDDFIEILSTEVQNELTDNGLNIIEGSSTTFPGRLWVVGHEAPLPDHPVTISDIRIDFDLSPYDDDSGPYLDMRIYFHGAGNHEADKSFKIEKGIDFILKLKEEGKLPTIN